LSSLLLLLLLPLAATAASPLGYYRFPTLHRDVIVFTAEGDLWRVGLAGGTAQRLTAHPGDESHATFSPDGKTLAFAAEYEGPTEVYTMPIEGGLPVRRTFSGGGVEPVGWTPDGKLLYATGRYATLPDEQLAWLDLATGASELLPLSQASQGVFEPLGETLFFTRLPLNRGSVKRYRGGTVENLWSYTHGQPEAKPLTLDYSGPSRWPLWWNGRVYFVTDRDGTMNLWSMDRDGHDLKQHTQHKGWDVKCPALSEGRIVYQLGADLRLYDVAAGTDVALSITLASDFDHQREKWIKKPLEYVTAAHLAPAGDRVALTARGQVFVVPVGPGRLVEATRRPGVRYRDARFFLDGKGLVALSDESGETEFTRLPANGVGRPEQLTRGGKVLRGEGVPSPDGKWLAWPDKDQQLWVSDLERQQPKLVGESPHWGFFDLAWSPDSRWLAYAVAADNQYHQIWIYRVQEGTKTALTSERVYSHSPAWSPDGKWIYYLSDRHLDSLVPSPWGPRQPEPFFDKLTKIYLVALKPDLRSPFEPPDELHPPEKDKDKDKDKKDEKKTDGPAGKDDKPAAKEAKDDKKEGADSKAAGSSTNRPVDVEIDLAGLSGRVWEVPVPPGNYSDLAINDKRLFWIAHDTSPEGKAHLQVLDIGNEEPKPKAFAEDIKGYEMSADGKKLLVHKGENYHVEDAAAAAPAKLEKSLDLKGWTFALQPREEWRQMFIEAWRLERDYFYDRKMHGVDWPATLNHYLPVVDRVTDRAELNDLIGEMVSELAALHIRVVGGDQREGPDQIKPGSLGARLGRDEARGGWRVEHIYLTDPDYPDKLGPLARPGVKVKEGDVIEAINGVSTLSVPHPQTLLRNQAGRQVLLRVRPSAAAAAREVLVKPLGREADAELRYAEWEYTRRLRVEKLGQGQLAYVHLRAMGKSDMAQWTREYYPVHDRKGLIVDVRHNGGGNIDSWILEKLIRKAWFYWQPRVGKPTWNMHYAFRGHLVVLCDEFTGSDGEAFTEGFKRLGLGKVIGKRTWGGEIWLTASNWLVDKGIATSAEIGVYGPEGQWLIENHGVDPDIVVDNPPHATFLGEDAQLQRAIDYLQEEIRLHPVEVPPAPPHPDKSAR
jgi:tricorn protease